MLLTSTSPVALLLLLFTSTGLFGKDGSNLVQGFTLTSLAVSRSNLSTSSIMLQQLPRRTNEYYMEDVEKDMIRDDTPLALLEKQEDEDEGYKEDLEEYARLSRYRQRERDDFFLSSQEIIQRERGSFVPVFAIFGAGSLVFIFFVCQWLPTLGDKYASERVLRVVMQQLMMY
jgi:hypothetical protein